MLHLVLKPHRDNLQAGTPDPQKLFVLLKVIPTATLANVRPPLALALVIDTSGSMRESTGGVSKLERAIEATDAILSDARLSPNDVVSLIQFDDEASAIWPLAPLGSRSGARAALQKLHHYQGGTRMAQGLMAARRELGRIQQGGVANRVLLLTDGEAFDAEDCPAAAQSLADLNAPLITIGVGDEYNEELLRDLAEIGRGRPYHLPKIEALGEVLGGEVGSSLREVITDLRAQIQTVAGVSLDSVTRVYPDLAEMQVTAQGDKMRAATLGNVQSGDYTVFVLELTLSERGAQRRARASGAGATVGRDADRAGRRRIGAAQHRGRLYRRDERRRNRGRRSFGLRPTTQRRPHGAERAAPGLNRRQGRQTIVARRARTDQTHRQSRGDADAARLARRTRKRRPTVVQYAQNYRARNAHPHHQNSGRRRAIGRAQRRRNPPFDRSVGTGDRILRETLL